MKKIISVIISMMVLILNFPVVQAEKAEKVTLIVEAEGDSVLALKNIAELKIDKAFDEDEEEMCRDGVIAHLESIEDKIDESVPGGIDVIFTYTDVFNGFAIETYPENIERIKNIPGVLSVEISQERISDDDPLYGQDNTEEIIHTIDSCCEMMNVGYMHENGINGKGTVIAIIDSEFNINHEIFSVMPQNPRYSKDDIREIAEKGLSTGVSGDQVYKNAKVPYAYNYKNKTSDTYSRSGVHGTHVAGIAAGNGGTLPNSEKYDGVAPEAQLICMSDPNLDDARVMAALDDAIKLDVDAINCSFGYTYESSSAHPDWEKAIKRVTDSGIIVSTSVGNNGRGYCEGLIPTEEPDYSTVSGFGDISSVTTVASAQNKYNWLSCYEAEVDGEKIPFYDTNKSAMFNTKFTSGKEFVICEGFNSEADLHVSGKIAVVERKYIQDISKLQMLVNAGAAGIMVIFNLDVRAVNVPAFGNCPIAIVALSDGDKLKNAEKKVLKTYTAIKNIYDLAASQGVSYYSSWGVDNTLELKPEICAPGGNIYSSYVNPDYKILSGTSMSAPHMTGAAALMYQYIRENPDKFTGCESKTEIKKWTENLIMSTAEVQMQSGDVPFSPRNQGAGMINLKAAAETPVVLTANGGKPKVSLGDKLSDNFSVSFEATSFYGDGEEYDVELTVLADDCYEQQGKKYVGNMKRLTSSADLSTVTVNMGETKTITLDVQLDKNETDAQSEAFPNGFFIDGFIRLVPKNTDIPEIGLPFTGFYGDWTMAKPLDRPFYDEESIFGKTHLASGKKHTTTNNDYSLKDDMCNILGTNKFTDEYMGEQYSGISPNGDGEFDYLCVNVAALRKTAKATFTINDSSNKKKLSSSVSTMDKYKQYSKQFTNLASLPDGNYKAVVSAEFDYTGAPTDSVTMNFYVDREKPKFSYIDIDVRDDRTYLKLVGSDNRNVMGFELYDTESKSIMIGKEAVDNSTEFDITDINYKTMVVKVYDYAMNCTSIDFPAVLNDVVEYNDGFVFDFTFFNPEKNDIYGDIVTAAYDSDGVMTAVSDERNAVIKQGTAKFNVKLDTKNISIVKVFVWNSFENMMPIYMVKFDINEFLSK